MRRIDGKETASIGCESEEYGRGCGKRKGGGRERRSGRGGVGWTGWGGGVSLRARREREKERVLAAGEALGFVYTLPERDVTTAISQTNCIQGVNRSVETEISYAVQDSLGNYVIPRYATEV